VFDQETQNGTRSSSRNGSELRTQGRQIALARD
jgi:hypothetical protein